jgi:hypothetical protein
MGKNGGGQMRARRHVEARGELCACVASKCDAFGGHFGVLLLCPRMGAKEAFGKGVTENSRGCVNAACAGHQRACCTKQKPFVTRCAALQNGNCGCFERFVQNSACLLQDLGP